MNLQALLAALGAILAAAGGIYLLVKEFRRRDRIASARQIDDLSDELTITRRDLLVYQQWAFDTSQTMASSGMVPPELPTVHPAAPGNNQSGVQNRLRRRRERRKQRREVR
jgi:hypothetical protein